jgi:hypothetical protein
MLGAALCTFALAASIMVSLVGTAQAAPKPKDPTAQGGGACGSATSSNPSPPKQATAGGLTPFDVAKWMGEKAATGVVEHTAIMGFEYISRISGLDRILPATPQDEILDQLREIKAQLDGVESQIQQLNQKMDQAITEERKFQFDAALKAVCSDVGRATQLYDLYVPAVNAATTLGRILESDHPEYADVRIDSLPPAIQALYTSSPVASCPSKEDLRILGCNTPRILVDTRQNAFADAFAPSALNGEIIAREISNALRPGQLSDSVLTAYGRTLMSKRFLTGDDSAALKALYDELAQGEALAAWMSAEYFSKYTAIHGNQQVFQSYLDNVAHEHLPPPIPQGDVIDLGGVNASDTLNRPIWRLATTQDQDYWPFNVPPFANDAVSTTASGATVAVNALNAAPCSGPVCFTHWQVPTRQQLTGLVQSCDSGKCNSALVAGQNVAAYLDSLNPNDIDWTAVFCDRTSKKVSCASPPTAHTFIWAQDQATQTMYCGYTIVPPSRYSRQYRLRTGLQTQSGNLAKAWALYPTLPGQVPSYQLGNPDFVHKLCDDYTRAQLALPQNKGVVLATDSTGTNNFMP